MAKVTCGSFPFRAHPTWDKVSPGLLSAGPGPRTSRSSGETEGEKGAEWVRRTPSRTPPIHHLASSKPPESGRKDAANAQCPLLGDPGSATPALWPPCSPPRPPLPATVAAPRRGSPAPRARRAPGPTECSSRPRSSGPTAGPRRGGGAGGGARRQGWR